MTHEDLTEFSNLIADMANSLFDSDDQVDCAFVRGEKKVTFILKPHDEKAAALVIGKKGRIIHRLDAFVEILGEVRGFDWNVVVEQPPKSA